MAPDDLTASWGIDWIASYPKSGNTWLRLLLTGYFAEGDAPLDLNGETVTRGAGSRRLFEGALGLSCDELLPGEALALRPAMYRVLAERHGEALWLKAHDQQALLGAAGWLFPPDVSGSVVYVMRNPLDVAVSLAFHDGHGDMERAVAKLCSADTAVGAHGDFQLSQHLGDWSGHVRSWVDQHDIPLLVVRYEDMLADAGAVLTRVIAFARPDVAVDPDRIARAVAQSRFETLQAAEDRSRFRETPRGATRFFRQGTAGDWRRHLSPDQAMRLCAVHGDTMRRFGYATEDGEKGG